LVSSASQAIEQPLANFIGGEWLPSQTGDTYERRNPWCPSEIVGAFPASTAEDADAAVRSAHGALDQWSSTTLPERCNILTAAAGLIEERAEVIARDMTRETGKPIREARSESLRVADVLRYGAAQLWHPAGEIFHQTAGAGRVYTRRAPLGVVALITPWNFPALIPAWKAVPALVCGNTIVIKPAEQSPLTCLHIAAVLAEAGLPPGVFNVLAGDGPSAGLPLIRHELVRAVSFTGSVPVGEAIREVASQSGKRVQLELGGHNPMIVLADADLQKAVEATFAGAYWSAGQKCMSTRRIFVEGAVYEDFKARLVERIARAVVGDPFLPETEVGPLVSEDQLHDVLRAVERARTDGASLLTGGSNVGDDSYLVPPTLFENVNDDAYLSCEEVFGPVASLYPFDSIEDAIERANAVPYGLSAAIFTSDAFAIQAFVQGVRAGVLRVNSGTVGAELHVPFGGIKASGYGPAEQGRAGIEFFSESSTVYENF
jgi:alpha-ketoglutaric semialdehyde dehydrogenase